jgi:anti-sigma B factor antagonist
LGDGRGLVTTPATASFLVLPGVDAAVVVLCGDFDYVTSRECEPEVIALLEGSPDSVVLDMTAVDFIDSSGIAMLLRIFQSVVRDGGGSLRVCSASPAAWRTFELCGLVERFGFEPSSGAA